MSFYDEVMRELVAAIGGALLVANLIALARRNRDADLVQAPVARSVAFAILGFVMLVAGIAALVA